MTQKNLELCLLLMQQPIVLLEYWLMGIDLLSSCSDNSRGVDYSQGINPGAGEIISTPLMLLNSEAFSAEPGIDGGVFSLDIELRSDGIQP